MGASSGEWEHPCHYSAPGSRRVRAGHHGGRSGMVATQRSRRAGTLAWHRKEKAWGEEQRAEERAAVAKMRDKAKRQQAP